MFNLNGLREYLINQIPVDSDWVDSEENFSENFTDSLKSNETENIFNVGQDECEQEKYFVGRDGMSKWFKEPFKNSRSHYQAHKSIPSQYAGPKEGAVECKAAIDFFLLFLSGEILHLLVHYTNTHLIEVRSQFTRKRDCNDTNIEEIKCIIGLMILMGLVKTKYENYEELWEERGLGIEVFRLSMSLNRFKFLKRTLQFNDKKNEDLELKNAHLASMREIFDLFAENCRKNYALSDNITTYDHFIRYDDQNPNNLHTDDEAKRRGVQIFTLINNNSFYVSDMLIHINEQQSGTCKDLSDPHKVVHRFIQKAPESATIVILAPSLNISSVKNLMCNKVHMTAVINKTEIQIPEEFGGTSNKQPNSCILGYQKNLALISYRSKNLKHTVLLTTEFDNINVNDKVPNLFPVIKSFDNAASIANKMHQMIFEHSVARKTKRYSLCLWNHIINIACMNSYVTYGMSHSEIPKREFLKQLGLSLVDTSIHKRKSNKALPRNLRESAAHFSSAQSLNPKIFDEIKNIPMRCIVCPRKKDIKIRTFCSVCNLPMCKKHMHLICEKCTN